MTVSQTYVAPPGWQPPPPRPPLTARAKSGARLAGIVGFLLLSVGFGLLSVPVALLAFGALFALVAEFIRRVAQDDAGFEQFMNGFERFEPTAWILPLVVVAIIGIGLMILGLFVSARILRSHGITRAWGVTWAGTGIAIVASWFLSGLTAVPFSLASGFVGNGSGGDVGSAIGASIAIGVVSLLFGLALTAVIGWLSWWWMAHALRPPVVSVATP